MPVTRVSFSGDRRDALLSARAAFNALLAAEIDMPRHEHLRADGRVYIDVDASEADVRSMLQHIVSSDTAYEMAQLSIADECANCGNVPDVPCALCPSCGYRDISACPMCKSEIARQNYQTVAGNLVSCPCCGTRLQMRFNEPLWRSDGTLNAPAVVLELAR